VINALTGQVESWYGKCPVSTNRELDVRPRPHFYLADYRLKTNGGPPTRFALRSTVTSTRSAILMNGMPLFIP
jgi:hypothetical protein